MAQKVIVELVDDIDGRPTPRPEGTIDFAIDGISYTIDLGPKNAKAFHKALDRYVEYTTRTAGRHTHAARPDPIRPAHPGMSPRQRIRDRRPWRHPTDIVQAYHDAN